MDIKKFSEKFQRSFPLKGRSHLQENMMTAALTTKLCKEEIQLLLNHLECPSWLNASQPRGFNGTMEEAQIIRRLRQTQAWIRKNHDDPTIQEKALKVIPMEMLSEKAESRIASMKAKGKAMEMDQALMLEPPDQIDILHGEPNSGEIAAEISRVELHQCRLCKNTERFPRVNRPLDLLASRRGRCGEWANCFMLICKSMGFETRYVMDWADHVWNEIKIPSLQRWVHVDCCENLMDAPLVYSLGWKKKLHRVYAIHSYYIIDVFHRYSKNEAPPLKSTWLRHSEHILCAAGLVFAPHKLNSLLDQAYAYLDKETVIASNSFEGRKSGDEGWRAARGEYSSFPKNLPKLEPIQASACKLVGDAKKINNVFELTSNHVDKRGAIWLPQAYSTRDSFCIEWGMEVSGNGGDGLAIVMGQSSEALGTGGCGLGYAGIPNSVAIEFDTFYNPEQGDPDDNHVSIQTCYQAPNSSHHDFSLASIPCSLDFNQGTPIRFRVLYKENIITLWIENGTHSWDLLLACSFEMQKLCAKDDQIFVGFTAATGGVSQSHKVKDIHATKF